MTMKIRYAIITAAAAVLLTSASCTKQSREMVYSSQETKIEAFVTKHLETTPDARVVYNGGSVRIVLSEGSGVELTARGKAAIDFAGYNFSSGSISSQNLFATNNYDFAMSSHWDLSDESVYEPLTVDLTDSNTIDGLRSGLEGVREGEECYILFSGKHAFGKNKNGTIPANSPLAFRVWVRTIEN